MKCDQCGMRKGFCAVTFGLALGLTFALSVIVWSAWVMWFGEPNMMEGHMMMKAAATWGEAGMMAVCAFIKGLLGGFVFALIYGMICRCKSKCCGKCSCCDGKK